MRLRLFHAPDGTRIAYREVGTGPALVLLHSAMLSHREWEPAVAHLTHRFRVVLPDLPLHGDSEDRPRHPYDLDWFADVVSAFCHEVGGTHPLVGGHGMGAEVALHATVTGRLRPARLVLMPTPLHRPPRDAARRELWRLTTLAGAVPGLDRALSHVAARLVFRPQRGVDLSARAEPGAADLVRHAFADVAGNAPRARSWARRAATWPRPGRRELLDDYARLDLPVLLLWASEDAHHPVATAEEALGLLPDGQLRVLSRAGYLLAYDDPVGLARELIAFCG